MKEFNEMEIAELEQIFGLKRLPNLLTTVSIYDGTINRGDDVWWSTDSGPKWISSTEDYHWDNICNFPFRYSIAKPKFYITQVSYY